MDKKNRVKEKLTVAALQLNSGADVHHNLNQVQNLVGQMNKLPDILVLPEVFNFRSFGNHEAPYSESLNGPSIECLKALAIEKKMHIIGGSITETSTNQKAFNTTVVIDDHGQIIGIYRKMHLFDVTLTDKNICESNRFKAGNRPTIVSILGWKIGLSICYDLRFPELYRHYFRSCVDMVVIPSSFTYETGKQHWHILCQARAIENQCFVIAPNQCGIGANNTKTYGHSLIIHPNGTVLAESDDSAIEYITAELEKSDVSTLRHRFPTIKHQRSEII